MPMNKAEKAELEAAHTLSALRWTAPVDRDVPPPSGRQGFGCLTTGWDFNSYSAVVTQKWSSSVHHGSGAAPAAQISGSQGARSFYSTELLALRALRHAVEKECAGKLRGIDRAIAAAIAQSTALPAANPPVLTYGGGE